MERECRQALPREGRQICYGPEECALFHMVDNQATGDWTGREDQWDAFRDRMGQFAEGLSCPYQPQLSEKLAAASDKAKR